MNNQQKSYVKPLVIILIIVVLIAAYLLFIKKPTVVTAPVVDQTSTTITGTTKAGHSTTTKTSTTTKNPDATISTAGLYSNTPYGFKVQLAAGAAIPEANAEANGASSFFFVGGDVKKLDVARGSCPSAEMAGATKMGSLAINGITFGRATGSGYDGGMESGSFDGYYCAMNKGMSYTIIVSDVYPRGEAGDTTPDPVATLKKFDQEIKMLNFQFTQ